MATTSNSPVRRGRPRKSAVTLGVKQSARIASKRVIKDVVNSNVSNPLMKVILIASLGALASYFINKK